MKNMNKLKNICIKYNLNKYIAITCVFLWIFLTLTNPNMQIYNSDEVWAYNIAQDLNFLEIIKLMHYEGHTFLWYTILKPFTHISSLYPEIVKYLNWLFCFASMILLWFFAPIKSYIKILIMFSSPFWVIYPTLGRDYGLTIFLLFLLTFFYKNRLQHVVLYSILLFFATNTCINGTFVTLILSCFFIYDIYRINNKNWKCKKFLLPFFVILSGFLVLAIQWLPVHTPKYFITENNLMLFIGFLFPKNNNMYLNFLTFLVFVPLFLTVLYIYIKYIKEFRWKIFAIYIIFATMFFFLVIAPGRHYHYYFLYIYLIMLYWLLIENSVNFINNKFLYISCTTFLVAVSLIFNTAYRPTKIWGMTQYQYNITLNQISKLIPVNSTIYLSMDRVQPFFYYLKNSYNLKTKSGDIIPSYAAYKSIWSGKKFELSKISVDTTNNSNTFFLTYIWNKNNETKMTFSKCKILYGNFKLCKLPIK